MHITKIYKKQNDGNSEPKKSDQSYYVNHFNLCFVPSFLGQPSLRKKPPDVRRLFSQAMVNQFIEIDVYSCCETRAINKQTSYVQEKQMRHHKHRQDMI